MQEASLPAPINYRARSLAFSAVALGVAVGLAWALTDTRTAPLTLDKPQTPDGWPCTFKLPKGWTVDEQELGRHGGRLKCSGMLRGKSTGQLELSFKRSPAVSDGYEAVSTYVAEVVGDLEPDARRWDPISIGPLAGASVSLEFVTPTGARSLLVGAVAIPSGPSFTIAMASDRRLASQQLHTFRSICESIEPKDWALVRSTGEAAKALGIALTPPPDTWVVDRTSRFRPVVAIVSGREAPKPLTATVWRTWLVEPRTLADLVVDRAVRGTMRSEPSGRVQHRKSNGRPSVWIEESYGDMLEIFVAVDAGNGQAAMLRVSGTREHATYLREATERLGESIRIEGSPEFDAEAAGRAAAARIAELCSPGLGTRWRPERRTDWYLFEQDGEPVGYQRLTRGAAKADDDVKGVAGAAWRGDTKIEWRVNDRTFRVESQWTCDDKLNAFEVHGRWLRGVGAAAEALDSTVSRNGDLQTLHIRTRHEGRRKETELKVTDRYMPDPLADDLIERCTTLKPGESLLVETLDIRARKPYTARYWREDIDLAPAGRAIFCQDDYDADRNVYLLDEAGRVTRIMLSENAFLDRSTRDEVREALRWMKEP